jgi:LmeA-like phospholipid-binding
VAALVLVSLALAVVLAQLLVPGIVAGRIRSRVGRYGPVRSVSVSVWPAFKAAWGSVDSVTVKAGSLALSPEQSAQLISESSGVSRMEVSASSVREGPLLLSDVHLSKRGRALSAEATVTAKAVAAALPPGLTVTLLGSRGGRVRVRVGGALFGLRTPIEAVGSASAGKLVATPSPSSLAGLRLTLFADPRIRIESVAARVASRRPLTYRLRMTASLR